MIRRYGGPAALFSLKCYGAAMLALFIALRIGLPHPYWALTTTYIVAQPLAGAVLSKAVFRAMGTLIGAGVAIAMVPNLVNAPELLVLGFGLWLGLCVYISILDRTPRSYLFVLAGYSACIIGLPSVDAPGAIFTVASLRAQEIGIGIACGALFHGLVLPGSVTAMLLRRVDGILKDAERWSRDSIAQEEVPGLDAERRRLALDITELHQLSVHLPYETTRTAPRVRTVRALQDQLSMILPLAAAVDDRMAALARRGRALPDAVAQLLHDACGWLSDPGTEIGGRNARAAALRARAAALEPEVTPDMGWDAALLLSLLSRLSALIGAHCDCRDLREQMAIHSRRPVTPRVAELLEGRKDRELHRDHGGAVRAGFAAAATVVLGCALWIGSGWPDGGSAVSLAGIFLALFSSADDPGVPLKSFLIGTSAAQLIAAFYGFVILPRVDGFVMLAAVLSPALLLGGAMMASPRYMIVALSAMLGLASPSLISDRYDSMFASFVNSAIAQVIGIYFAIVMARLLRSAGLDGAIRRTIKAGWTDIARRSNMAGPPNLRGWLSRMLDRIGLLAPRLAARGDDPGKPLYDALRDLRTGVVIGELRQLRHDLPPVEGEVVTPVLRDVGAYYAGLDPDDVAPPPAGMLANIDGAMGKITASPSRAARRTGVLALVSLRRNLFPGAGPYQGATT